jgi:hypothetical protein
VAAPVDNAVDGMEGTMKRIKTVRRWGPMGRNGDIDLDSLVRTRKYANWFFARDREAVVPVTVTYTWEVPAKGRKR